MVNKKRLIHLTRKLIQINSENPPGNEAAIARFVAGKLQRAGLKVKFYSFAKARPNVIAVFKGRNSRRQLLVSPHLDTVPAGEGWRVYPFAGKIINGKIYGRGSSDCKGNLAVGIEALVSLAEEGFKPHNDIIFAATADEESGSALGILPLVEKNIIRPAAAVILDSDDFNIIIAQKGLIHFKIKIFGKKAHGAYPHLGVNAIELAAAVINDLKKFRFKFSAHPRLRSPTVNIGTIKGGEKVNMVADYCEMEVDLRFLPGMRAPDIRRQIKRIISRRAKKFKIEIAGIQKPCSIAANHPLVKSLLKANHRLGIRPKLSGSEGATVISFFLNKGIPALATGFGKTGTAHANDEYAVVNDLWQGAKVLENFLKLCAV
ncbi:MAG: M20 family metallopeptidase [Candidatus Omnitrophota bacterium]